MFKIDWTQEHIQCFVETVNDLIEKGHAYKTDKTSTVCKTSFNHAKVVIKRYNNKGAWHCLKNTFRRSRAEKSWIKSLVLSDIGIFTPPPIGWFVEKRNGLYFRSYFVMDYCEMPTLHSFLMENRPNERSWKQITNGMAVLLERLKEHRITHGDLKHSNVLIGDNQIGILDLDAMIIHRNPVTYRIKRSKDERKFKERLMQDPTLYFQSRKQKQHHKQ